MKLHKKPSMRKILWNFVPCSSEELIEYFFVIVNDSREISDLSSRIFKKFAPIQELRTSDITLQNKELKARIIYFTSQRFFEDIYDIYKGKIKKDSRLYLRHKTGFTGLESYVESRIKDYFKH